MVGMHVNIGVLRGTRLCRNNNLHLGKLGRRPHLIISSSLIESELYSLSTAGAIAFTACTAAPGQLGNLLRQTPPTQPADSLLWTGITVLSALPFCGWMVWPGIGLLRARSGVPFPSHYAAFAALYALPLIRAAIFGLDELALISVFFCVAHAQVERMLAPALLPVATSSIPCDEQQSPEQPSPEPPAAPVEPQVDPVSKADAEAITGWDRRWALRSMSVSQLLTLSRDHGIRGRSRMSKRQLLEALEAVGAHETLQLEQCTGKGSK